jgi:hypothetical protein
VTFVASFSPAEASMTEQQWLECVDPHPMLQFLGDKIDDRRYRLFVVACCRRIWNLLPGVSRRCIEVGEQFADGLANEKDLQEVDEQRRRDTSPLPNESIAALITADVSVTIPLHWGDAATAVYWAAWAVAVTRTGAQDLSAKDLNEQAEQCRLVREICGNPFRPVAIDPSWLSWNDGTVKKIVRQMRMTSELERVVSAPSTCFESLPVLADALEDAGCRDEALLAHCRQSEPHVHGCWALDLLWTAVREADRAEKEAAREKAMDALIETGKKFTSDVGNLLATVQQREQQRTEARQRMVVWALMVVLVVVTLAVFVVLLGR